MSSQLPPWCDKRLANTPPKNIEASETPAAASIEKCCSLSLPHSAGGWQPRVLRHVHCITNGQGMFLTDLISGQPQWNQNPATAAGNGHAWLSSTVASAALHRLREQMPDTELGLSLVVLRFRLGRWEVVSAEGFGVGSLSGQREVVS